MPWTYTVHDEGTDTVYEGFKSLRCSQPPEPGAAVAIGFVWDSIEVWWVEPGAEKTAMDELKRYYHEQWEDHNVTVLLCKDYSVIK